MPTSRAQTQRPSYVSRVTRPIMVEPLSSEVSSDMFAEIVAQAPDYVLVVDPNGVIELVNRVDPPQRQEDVLGTGAWLHLQCSPESLRTTIARVLAGKEARDRVINTQGERGERWLLVRMRALETLSGKRAVIFLSDITEQKTTELELARTAGKLEASRRAADQAQKFEALGRLAGGVAHDFNNLLTSIISFSRFVLDDLAPGDPRRADLTEVLRAADSAAKLTSQLLAFSRKRPVEPRCVELKAAVTTLGALLGRVVGERVRLQIEHGEQPVHVLIDPGQLDQVMMNLAVNAKDAMPAGGTLTIAVGKQQIERHEVLPAGEYVTLSVRDTGVGMDESTRRQAFDPFFTTKGEQGTGLGLATCYGIVKQALGHIEIESEPGAGACFTVLLPVAAADQAPRGDNAAAPTKSMQLEGLALVVEDQPAIRRTMVRSLKELGMQVLEAASSEEALSLVEALSAQVDLLVTDVLLPGATGVKLAETLRARAPKLRVVVCSGYLGAENENKAEMEGTDTAFLGKPFTGRQLMTVVGTLYGTR